MGPELCSVLPAVHALTEADYTSTFGTKTAGLNCNPVQFLTNFEISVDDCNMMNSMKKAEEYLVQLWKRGSNCQTLDQLRLWLYHQTKTGLVLNELPTTSRCTKGHLFIAYYHTFLQIHCLHNIQTDLDKQMFGFEIVHNMLMPATLTKQFPSDFIHACTCVKCAKTSSTCRISEYECCVLQMLQRQLYW